MTGATRAKSRQKLPTLKIRPIKSTKPLGSPATAAIMAICVGTTLIVVISIVVIFTMTSIMMRPKAMLPTTIIVRLHKDMKKFRPAHSLWHYFIFVILTASLCGTLMFTALTVMGDIPV